MPNPNPTAAVKIVLAEERARGWTPRVLGASEQKANGCDIISTPPSSNAEPDFIEVKAWGRPFLTRSGKWSWPGFVVRESQLAACHDARSFRFEIVGNLDAHRERGESYERLTLTSSDVIGNETSHVVHEVKLVEALKPNIRRGI
jgi:hypothetical protein